MKCPICEVDLQMTDRQGIEIDYCPRCRGVWLDRGELDKLIERSATVERSATIERSPPGEAEWDASRSRGAPHGRGEPHGDYRRRKKSFWREIFDFD